MSIVRWPALGAMLAFVLAGATGIVGCRRDNRSRRTASDATGGSAAAAAGSGAFPAQPARPDPCSFVPLDEAKRLLGPLAGQPWRARSLDDTTSKADGMTCIYPLTPRENVAEHSVIALELATEGAIGFETGASMMNSLVKSMLGSEGVKTADGARRNVDGWDYLGGFTDRMTARVGHVAISAKWEQARGAVDSLLRVMAIMRDNIPDIPFRSAERGSTREDGDPCILVTRAEAEAVLGTLTVPPYPSVNLTGLADEDGNACSYYVGRHRVLSIEPTWSQGKTMFRMMAGLSQGVEAKLRAPGEAADTLEGNWDQVAALAGDLYFLKGDRMLAISYRTSSTDKTGALKLASIAIKRLAEAK